MRPASGICSRLSSTSRVPGCWASAAPVTRPASHPATLRTHGQPQRATHRRDLRPPAGSTTPPREVLQEVVGSCECEARLADSAPPEHGHEALLHIDQCLTQTSGIGVTADQHCRFHGQICRADVQRERRWKVASSLPFDLGTEQRHRGREVLETVRAQCLSYECVANQIGCHAGQQHLPAMRGRRALGPRDESRDRRPRTRHARSVRRATPSAHAARRHLEAMGALVHLAAPPPPLAQLPLDPRTSRRTHPRRHCQPSRRTTRSRLARSRDEPRLLPASQPQVCWRAGLSPPCP